MRIIDNGYVDVVPITFFLLTLSINYDIMAI